MAQREVFFAEQKEQSAVKSMIVNNYFRAWAKVMKVQVESRGNNARIAYLDLFAGPGRYEDGAKSTPLLILETALADPWLRDHLVTIFNDKDEKNTKSLQTALSELPDAASIRHRPILMNNEVGTEMVKAFDSLSLAPTLFFVDPWGYKGLSLKLINSVLKNWGCDCIFFFNYSRINAGLSNPMVRSHMEGLFGEERVAILQRQLEPLSPSARESAIVEALATALRELGGKFTLPFQFVNAKKERTTHYLIFVSKHDLGYDIMKDIMAKASSQEEQGVAAFRYCQADAMNPFLFGLTKPLDALGPMLLDSFQGQRLSVKDVYDRHKLGTPYILANYQEVLRRLEASGSVTINPPSSQRRKNTLAKHCTVSFPPRRP